MAKSKIIQELAESTCSLEIALNRLYVILAELGDKDLMNWAKKEKDGYNRDDELPDYRKVHASIMGDYQFVQLSRIERYTHRALPTIGLTAEMLDVFENHKLFDSISVLEDFVSKDGKSKEGKVLASPIPMEMWQLLEKGTNIQITRAFCEISEITIKKVIDTIKSSMLDILITLEKKFGMLDGLDIPKMSDKTRNQIVLECKQAIQGGGITINDFSGAKIKKSAIATAENANKITNKKETKKLKDSNMGNGSNAVKKSTDIDIDIKTENPIKKKSFWSKLFPWNWGK